MFTGIIKSNGIIASVKNESGSLVLCINGKTHGTSKIGDSVSIDGCCLTITAIKGNVFSVNVMPETVKKTTIKYYKKGSFVNMEFPLKLNSGLDGHLVQGHIDFTGTVKSSKNSCGDAKLKITHPANMAKYIALKGSITVNGVSLTVSMLNDKDFEVSLIPQTLLATNLGLLKKGQKVNVEIDMISRYLESLLKEKSNTINHQFLKERGFL
jgi:riboflavin synthase